MNRVCVVLKQPWEYNDEYYYKSDSGGDPVKVFTSRKKADDYALQQNIEECKQILTSSTRDILDYTGYEKISSLLSHNRKWGASVSKKDSKRLMSYFDITGSYYDSSSNELAGISKESANNIPDEDWILLGSLLNLNSFYVEVVLFEQD